MSKAVMISIQPKWCELIANGKKTVEVRKTKPKLKPPFKCYIYCTKGKNLLKARNRPLLLLDGVETRQVWSEDDYCSWEDVNGKVIGEFVCDRILEYEIEGYDKNENVLQKINRLAYDEEWEETIEYTEVSNVMTEYEMRCSYLLRRSRLTFDEIGEYVCGVKEFGFYKFYGWQISNLVIYDIPKELSEFKIECKFFDDDTDINCDGCEWFWHESNESVGYYSECCCDGLKPLTRPPRSWCYVEEI